jgi:hypothetical protein
MANDNRLWGAPRIHGELLKLGITVSERTVSRYLSHQRRPPSQTWRTFLTNHLCQLPVISLALSPCRLQGSGDVIAITSLPVQPMPLVCMGRTPHITACAANRSPERHACCASEMTVSTALTRDTAAAVTRRDRNGCGRRSAQFRQETMHPVRRVSLRRTTGHGPLKAEPTFASQHTGHFYSRSGVSRQRRQEGDNVCLICGAHLHGFAAGRILAKHSR